MKIDRRRRAPWRFPSAVFGLVLAAVSAGVMNSPAVAADAVEVKLGDPALTAGVPGAGPISLPQIEQWLDDPANFVELTPILPLGLSQGAAQIVGLDENPLTRAKIELGRQLYFDTRLSKNSTVSCASCHDPSMGYSAHTKTGIGIDGQAGGRNSPVAYNRILSGKQFWDGRVDSLEAQAVGPIANPIEMGFTHEGVVKRLAGIPVYAKQFEKVFGGVTIDAVGKAIAAFERVIVTAPSPYDYNEQWRPFQDLEPEDLEDDPELAKLYAAAKAGVEAHPMSESAKRGREIFFTEKGNCSMLGPTSPMRSTTTSALAWTKTSLTLAALRSLRRTTALLKRRPSATSPSPPPTCMMAQSPRWKRWSSGMTKVAIRAST